MSMCSRIGRGVTRIKVLMRIERQKDAWLKPNQGCISVLRTDGEGGHIKINSVTIGDRFWTEVPDATLEKLLLIEKTLMHILTFGQEIMNFQSPSEVFAGEEKMVLAATTYGIRDIALFDFVKVGGIIEDNPHRDIILSYLRNKKGKGRTRLESEHLLRSEVKWGISKFAIEILDKDVPGLKHVIKEDIE